MIPDDLIAKIERQLGEVHRKNCAEVAQALLVLNVDPKSEFGEFFFNYVVTCYRRPVSSSELCDLLLPTPEIHQATQFIRDVWGLPDRYVCFSSLQGEGCYLYDRNTGCVFDFDLAELEYLLQERLSPRWGTFFEFMDWYLTDD